MVRDPYEPTREQQAVLDWLRNPHPEPRPHVCGRCRNPYTGGREDCPNARRTSG